MLMKKRLFFDHVIKEHLNKSIRIALLGLYKPLFHTPQHHS